MKRWYVLLFRIFASVLVSEQLGCSGSDIAFDLANTSETFRQNDLQSSKTIDILWVIDNSASMDTSQNNLRANFDSFLNQFQSRNMDFQMAVTTTEAYRTLFNGMGEKSIFRDTSSSGVSSGYKVVTPLTPDFRGVMMNNLAQGTTGNGDERAFQSFITALKNPTNSGFIRQNSFLAIVILSDEDDFSHDQEFDIVGQYSNPALHPVENYRDELDFLTNSTPEFRKYSVSAIAIKDAACRNQLLQPAGAQRIGQRYIDLAAITDGLVGSLCGNFADTLNQISARILELLTGFRLDRVPKPTSISVSVDGVIIKQDPLNGWTYDSQRNMIVFHGTSIPNRNAIISVGFQPKDTRR